MELRPKILATVKAVKFALRYIRRVFLGSRVRIVHIKNVDGLDVYQVQQKKLSMNSSTNKLWDWIPVSKNNKTNFLDYKEAKDLFDIVIELGGHEKIKVIKKL